MAGSAVTSTGRPSSINGNLGVSPGADISGIPTGTAINGVVHAADAVALPAQNDMTTAYNVAAGLPPNTGLTGHWSQLPIPPQLVLIRALSFSTDKATLATGSTPTIATAASVALINSASSCNAFWQVGGSATIGTATASVRNILASRPITKTTGTRIDGGLRPRRCGDFGHEPRGGQEVATNEVTRTALRASRVDAIICQEPSDCDCCRDCTLAECSRLCSCRLLSNCDCRRTSEVYFMAGA
ncbi:Uncharacterized protein TCAP_06495 [Tolypocladium capitatum]|uniref:Uncharacterized protein n=1 Tax=Tolypocladium capitatum TaxID=45235 RepID=A0A2K3Q7K9_9HYPO|nr:Uncharacterized protein TCAP_06495 [Tolypocladium capitatum]